MTGPSTMVAPETPPAGPDDEFIDGDQLDDTQPISDGVPTLPPQPPPPPPPPGISWDPQRR